MSYFSVQYFNIFSKYFEWDMLRKCWALLPACTFFMSFFSLAVYIPKTCTIPTNVQRNWTYSLSEASSWHIYETNVYSCPVAWCLPIKKCHLKVVSCVWNQFRFLARFQVSFPESHCGNAYVHIYMFACLYKVNVLVAQKELKNAWL